MKISVRENRARIIQANDHTRFLLMTTRLAGLTGLGDRKFVADLESSRTIFRADLKRILVSGKQGIQIKTGCSEWSWSVFATDFSIRIGCKLFLGNNLTKLRKWALARKSN